MVSEAAAAVSMSGDRNIAQLIKPKRDTGRALKPPNSPTLTAARFTTKLAIKSSNAATTHSHHRGRRLHSAISMAKGLRYRRTMLAAIVRMSSRGAKRLVWRVMDIIYMGGL